MAKQSGLHQIKGKVGEHSYYKQSGVSGGLIRSINQGLSARVKNGAEYANTRLNNQEFGAACNVAALLGKMVEPKFRPMILPFSQSKMAKEILKLARQNATPWGQRTVTGSQTPQIAAALSATSKRSLSDFFTVGVARVDATSATLSVSYSSAQASLMSSLGINALSVIGVQYDLATGQFNSITGEMATGYLYKRDTQPIFDEADLNASGQSYNEDITVATFVPEANHAGHQIVVFVALPMYNDGTNYYIRQEYCSFVAVQLPSA